MKQKQSKVCVCHGSQRNDSTSDNNTTQQLALKPVKMCSGSQKAQMRDYILVLWEVFRLSNIIYVNTIYTSVQNGSGGNYSSK